MALAYYNELEPYAAQWLRNLQFRGLIAPGYVDARDVREVTPRELAGYTQCHFFAGVGVWSHALRLAGWPDDVPVWTGSCPCQPFSQAGKRKGTDDARHLWPEWFRLIREQGPPIVFGEQVASPDGLEWFDAVSTDLENAGYAVGAADLCAAGVGAPHIRQRLFFVAVAFGERLEGLLAQLRARRSEQHRAEVIGRGAADVLGDAHRAGQGESAELGAIHRAEGARTAGFNGTDEPVFAGVLEHMAHAAGDGALFGSAPFAGGDRAHERVPRPNGGVGGMADTDGFVSGQGGPLRGGRDHRSDALEGAGFGSGGESGVLADAASARREGSEDGLRGQEQRLGAAGVAHVMAHTHEPRSQGWELGGDGARERIARAAGMALELGDAGSGGGGGHPGSLLGAQGEGDLERLIPRRISHELVPPGSTRGFWADAEWIFCRDGKFRPVEPGTQPLAHGSPERVVGSGAVETQPRSGLLRAYGNAIVPQVAATFIRAVIDGL